MQKDSSKGRDGGKAKAATEVFLRIVEHWVAATAIAGFGMTAFYEPSPVPGESWEWLFWMCICVAFAIILLASSIATAELLPTPPPEASKRLKWIDFIVTMLVASVLCYGAYRTVTTSAEWFDNKEVLRRCRANPEHTYKIKRGGKQVEVVCRAINDRVDGKVAIPEVKGDAPPRNSSDGH